MVVVVGAAVVGSSSRVDGRPVDCSAAVYSLHHTYLYECLLTPVVLQADFDAEALRQKQLERWGEEQQAQQAQQAQQRPPHEAAPAERGSKRDPGTPTWDAVDRECSIELPEGS